MKRALFCAVGVLSSSCATVCNDGGDVCGAVGNAIGGGIAIAIVVVPFAAGCVVGAGTRCCESGDDDGRAVDDAPVAEAAPADAEVDDVAY